MSKERGSVTLIGTLVLAMFTVLLLSSFVKISKSMKDIDVRRDTYECMIRYREDFGKYVMRIAEKNRQILIIYAASSVTKPTFIVGAGYSLFLQLEQTIIHAHFLRKIKHYKQCTSENKKMLIAGLPYLHTGKLTRNFMGTTIPRPPMPIVITAEDKSFRLIMTYTITSNLDLRPTYFELEE